MTPFLLTHPWAGLALLATSTIWVVAESSLRRHRSAPVARRDIAAEVPVGVATAVAVFLIFQSGSWLWLAMPPSAAGFIVGMMLMAAGVAVRVYSVRVLGRYFTPVLCLYEEHRLVRSGPYRLVRHPGYAGAMLGLVGLAVAIGNWVAVLCALGVYPLLIGRVHREELMLRERFGDEYTWYAEATPMLLPIPRRRRARN